MWIFVHILSSRTNLRGVERAEKQVVIQLLSQGIPIKVIVEKMNIPMTTVCEWAKVVRKEKQKISGHYEKTDTIHSFIKNSEAKISNIVSAYMSAEVTDEEWFEVESRINAELQKLVDKTLENINAK